MLPSRQRLFQGRPCVFQQDNAKPHTRDTSRDRFFRFYLVPLPPATFMFCPAPARKSSHKSNLYRFFFSHTQVSSRPHPHSPIKSCPAPHPVALGPAVLPQECRSLPHTASITTAWLHSRKVRVLNWPACSPDLSPIENIWRIIKRKIRQRRPQTLQQLETYSVLH